jgi:hypothetical protein
MREGVVGDPWRIKLRPGRPMAGAFHIPNLARPEARAGVMAAIGICYTLLAVFELWRGRGDGVWRWPIMVLLLCHAATIPIHIPVAGAWQHPDPADVDLLNLHGLRGRVCINLRGVFIRGFR